MQSACICRGGCKRCPDIDESLDETRVNCCRRQLLHSALEHVDMSLYALLEQLVALRSRTVRSVSKANRLLNLVPVLHQRVQNLDLPCTGNVRAKLLPPHRGQVAPHTAQIVQDVERASQFAVLIAERNAEPLEFLFEFRDKSFNFFAVFANAAKSLRNHNKTRRNRGHVSQSCEATRDKCH